jgi:membrane peptidoglycan carboxypeptidase
LAQACSAVANGGLLVPPRLILKEGGEAVPVVAPHRILKPETAITMRKMMEGVVLVGTGRRYANLRGYSSAGKTGSAQIFDYATRRYTHSYNASFMGFAPVANPAIVVVVTVNGTRGGSAGYGGPVAGPVFRAVATEALRVLDVPKDLPDTAPDKPETHETDPDEVPILDGPIEPPVLEEADAEAPEEPGLCGAGNSARSRLSAGSGRLKGGCGQDWPPHQANGPTPEDPAAQPGNRIANVDKLPAPKVSGGPHAPNFIGMSMRSVVALAQAQGLPVISAGTGIVRAQVPPPGAVLHGGERIRVDLAR